MPVNETLGDWSASLMFLAALTYAAAFVTFTWDLATGTRLDKAYRQARAAALPASGARATKVPVAAATAHGRPGGPDPHAGERPPAWTIKAAAGADTRMADEDMRYGTQRRAAARAAVALTGLALMIHAGAVVTRGVAAGRVPWGNMYEFSTTGAMVVAAVFLAALTRRDLRFLGTFVIGLVLVMLMAATMGFYTPVAHLVPALQSYWLVIHVSIAVTASGLFTLTFAMSVLQLIQGRRESALASGRTDRSTFLRLVPSATSLEALSYRINTVAFVLWTFTLMAGAIWAEAAWGRYWGWDTKEVWTFVIWVVYASYLHARATRGWGGARAAWLSITGYLCVVFNFAIVNVFFTGLHSYAGLPS